MYTEDSITALKSDLNLGCHLLLCDLFCTSKCLNKTR